MKKLLFQLVGHQIVNIFYVFVALGSVSGFLIQCYHSWDLFQNNKKYFMAVISKVDFHEFPDIHVCPNPPYNVEKLLDKELDLSLDYRIYASHQPRALNGIDQNMSLADFFSIAKWNLGQVISGIEINGVRTEYSPDTVQAEYWSLSSETFLPCFRLSPPKISAENVTLSITKSTLPSNSVCNSSDNYTRPHIDEMFGLCNRSVILQQFNSSRGYHRYLLNNLYVSKTTTLYTDSTTYLTVNLVIDTEDSYAMFNGTEMFVEKTVREPLKTPEQVEKSDCLRQCFEQMMSEDRCVPLSPISELYPIKDICPINKFSGDKCREKCPTMQLTKWLISRMSLLESSGDYNIFKITSLSEKFTRFVETETYSYEKFLSDLGGNLGFFLGLSAFILMGNLLQGVQYFVKNKYWLLAMKRLLQVANLLFWCFTLYLAGEQILKMNYSHAYSAVKYRSIYCRSGQVCSSGATTGDYISALTSATSLGCQPLPVGERDRCFDRCAKTFISRTQSNIPHLAIGEPLPVCTEADYSLVTSLKMQLWTRLVDVANSGVAETRCEMLCGSLPNVSHETRMGFYPKLFESQSTSYEQLFCIIAGFVGLYLGCSCIDMNKCHELLKSVVTSSKPAWKRVASALWLLCSALIFCFSIYVVLYQVNEYFFHHLVVKISKVEMLYPKDLPAISVCPRLKEDHFYPPSANASLNKLSNLTSTNIHFFESQVFANFSCDGINFETQREVVPLDRGLCYSCVPKQSTDLKVSYYPSSCAKYTRSKNFLTNTDLILFVHSPSDVLAWDGDVDEVTDTYYTKLLLSEISYYVGFNYDTKSNSLCYRDCLLNLARNKQKKEMNSNNVFHDFLDPPDMSNVYDDKTKTACKRACVKTKHTHLSGEIKTMKPSSISDVSRLNYIKIRAQANDTEQKFCALMSLLTTANHLEDTDGYPLTQLVSDTGSAVGFVLGVSVVAAGCALIRALSNSATKSKVSPQ